MTESCENEGRSEVEFVAFALGDCVVDVEQKSAKYLRPVHRTALELAIHNRFGAEIGGFWLMPDQIDQLKKLPEYYPINEAPFVARAVEARIAAARFGGGGAVGLNAPNAVVAGVGDQHSAVG